jgi:LysM repeat protein/ABC-type branched-subunit amino acid transport system substrate-binding protein
MLLMSNWIKKLSEGFALRNLLPSLLILFSCWSVTGQDAKNYDKVVIGDFRFILHTVQKKETLYSIARQYDCTQEEVLANNKNIAGVIKKGMVLKIPDHSYQRPQAARVDENKFIKHLVKSGDNYYQLKLKYGVDEEELLKFNPELKEGLKIGKSVLIPKKSKAEIDSNEDFSDNKPSGKNSSPPGEKSNAKILNIGLYLPISASITDSLKPTARTLSFLAFYQGALLAADRLSKTGVNTKLYVYDTEKPNSKIETLVKKPEFLSLDLIIGPVYPEIQKLVSELSAKNRIPMVSPLSQDDRIVKSNPFYFQVNPVRKRRIEATADYIVREFQRDKITFFEVENGSQDTKLIRDLVIKRSIAKGAGKSQIQVYNLWSKGTEALEPQLKADKPNIFVLAEMNEVNVSIAMNRLTLLSKKYPVVLLGLQEFTRMQSIETENLHNVNLHYLANSFVDYSFPAVTAFIENFKTEYSSEPSIFAFQGYDILTYFVQSLQKYDDVSNGIPQGNNEGLLNSAYHFSRVSELGGYSNDAFTIIEYTTGYEVKSLGLITAK